MWFLVGLLYDADGSVRSVRQWRSEVAAVQTFQSLAQAQTLLQTPPAAATAQAVMCSGSDCAPEPSSLRRVHTIAAADRYASTLLLGDRELIRLYNSSSQLLTTVLRLKYEFNTFLEYLLELFERRHTISVLKQYLLLYTIYFNRQPAEAEAQDSDWVYSLSAATTSASVFFADPVRRTVHRLAAPRFDSLGDRVAGIEGFQCTPSSGVADGNNRTCRDGVAAQVPLYAPSGMIEVVFFWNILSSKFRCIVKCVVDIEILIHCKQLYSI